MFFVFHVQVFERSNERLSLKPSGGSRGNGRVTYGAFCADGSYVAPQRRSEATHLVPGLNNAADMEAAAEINTVQDLKQQRSVTADSRQMSR